MRAFFNKNRSAVFGVLAVLTWGFSGPPRASAAGFNPFQPKAASSGASAAKPGAAGSQAGGPGILVPSIRQADSSPTDQGTVIINVSNSPDVQEGSPNAAAVFTVTLSQPRKATTVTVQYFTTSGTAAAGYDYVATSGILTFQPGQTSKTVSVKVLNDSPDGKSRETFFLNLSNPSNPGAKAKIGSGTGQAVIIQPRTLPQLSIHSATTTEGRTNHTVFVQVTLSQATNQDVTFLANTEAGTAGAHGVDYHGFSSTPFTIKAGQTSVSIPIEITGASNAPEGPEKGNEYFSVNVTQVTTSNAAIGTGHATVTLFP